MIGVRYEVTKDGLVHVFGVMTAPSHKRPSLYVVDGNVHHLLASFNSEQSAELFMSLLDRVLPGLRYEAGV